MSTEDLLKWAKDVHLTTTNPEIFALLMALIDRIEEEEVCES